MPRFNGPTESLLLEVVEVLGEDQAKLNKVIGAVCSEKVARAEKDRINAKHEPLITKVAKLIARLKERE